MKCRLCQKGIVDLMFDFGNQPIIHRLLNEPDQSYRTFPFKVGYCQLCGFMQLIDGIPPEELYQNYFTVSGWKNQPHVPRLIQLMENVFDLGTRSRILEIGCNDGVFMEGLAKLGYGNSIGLEPTLDAYNLAIERGLNVINGFFGRAIVNELIGDNRPDLIVSRQVMEHIPDLHEFLTCAWDVLQPNGGMVLEVPDHSMNYETLDYSFWEEHCNYFTLHTLSALLLMHGFEIVHHESTLFSGKALLVFAQKCSRVRGPTQPRNLDHERAMRFQKYYPILKKSMRNYLDNVSEYGIAMYGAGARSCNFVNLLELGEYIDVIIDDQPEKQNKFVPGAITPIRTYSEEYAKRFFLLGINCENEKKVITRRKLATYASILPPSRLLPDFWRNMSYVGF
jgi:2-polyprenyl-3-methyl-5-hydroxy-6-metoxy-1,4-benzoquinol methylase